MEKIIIIGGGPAGLSAAIYAARAGLKPVVFAGSPAGGQLTLTSDVENFPGQEAILGVELVEKIRKQAEKFGARIMDKNVVKVNASKMPFEIYLADSTKVLSQSIIIATGARAIWLGLESEKRLRGKGVSACATCDGFFFRGKDVAVVGGGDTALEEALTLAKFAHKVYLIHRRESFRASEVMQKRVFSDKKIEVIWNAQVKEILGEQRVEGVELNSKNIKVAGVFVAIGHKPDTGLFVDQLKLDTKGYLLKNFDVHFPSMTSTAGVFAAGDCADPYYRQAATAAGTGVAAAIDAERWLKTL